MRSMEALTAKRLVLRLRGLSRAGTTLILVISGALAAPTANAAEPTPKTDRAVELKTVEIAPTLIDRLSTMLPGQSEVVAARLTAETAEAVQKSVVAERKAAAKRASRSMMRMAAPAYGRITATFGRQGRYWSNRHTGMDIRAPYGARVYSVVSGTVVKVAYDRAYGRVIVVRGGGVDIWYAHLSRAYVKSGQKVKRGKVIGRVGNSGNTYGTHLHLEVRKNDRPTDPAAFLYGKKRGKAAPAPEWTRYRVAKLSDL